jgi:hypothetical protein
MKKYELCRSLSIPIKYTQISTRSNRLRIGANYIIAG